MLHFILRLFLITTLAFVLFGGPDCTSKSNPANTSTEGSIFESGTVAPGGTYSHVFMTVGSIPYNCRFHVSMGMVGTINVMAGGTPSTDTVTMNAVTFSPANLTIDVGDTILWINKSGVNHTATSDN
jgi:plastocyanin